MTESLASQSIFREVRRSSIPLAGPHDAALIAILEAPLRAGETALVGFARKEYELAAAFAQLPVVDAHLVRARLANPREGDELAARFHWLVAPRRDRLLAFLADARRRAAVAARAR